MGRSIVFSLILLLGVGISNYVVKNRVIKLESEIISMRKQMNRYEEGLHVLQAEWSYLNRPERLQALAQDKLGLIITDHHHLVSYEAAEDRFVDPLGGEDLVSPEEELSQTHIHFTSVR